ncbi:MMPL family transporter [Bacillus sp. DNRA2]|uniref:MMPL family transporter n=1 Tax=Bacillus sp. DNRA2 TaxID=2723053 RepID=UPI00145CFD5A|nr:MMPL family transporter [Bacillus sp. DNRA2]NMD69662.1 MMPL family transporter [Bacillus sp. DNRA2]
MYTLGLFMSRYKKTVIVIWIAILAVLGFFALKLPTVLSGNGFDFDGEYEHTRQILDDDFKQPKSVIIVLFEKQKSVDDATWKQFINESLNKAADAPAVEKVISPLQQKDMIKGNYAYGILTFEKDSEDLTATIDKLKDQLKSKKNIKVSLTGEPVIVKDLNHASQADLAKAEMIGLPIALVVLVLAFGSLVAASLPIIVGVISIATTMGIVYFFSYAFDLTIFILNIIPMIGLALSIDFALLFINRFKEEIAHSSVEKAVITTVATAGRSILFSASCVFIGLLGLMFIEIDIFRNVAIGGMTVVLIAALSAITFLPAILALLGKRIHSLTILKTNSGGEGIWSKLAHLVMKRPVLMATLALIVLITALIPVKDMDVTVPGINALPTTYESRAAYDTYQDKFIDKKQSSDNTVVLVLENDKKSETALSIDNLEKVQATIHKLEKNKDVESVESIFSLSGITDSTQLSMALSQPNSPLVPLAAQYSADNKMLLHVFLKEKLSTSEKRDWVREWLKKDLDLKATFGGSIKFEQEIFDEILKQMPKGLALIFISTFLILMLAFRSLLIPIKAIIMNVLSLSATFGIVVWIFQEGHLGLDPTSITLMLPVFVFSLVFGLSMDYEVFLISRIHEIYVDTKDNHYATLNGLISTSKIITSAAAIMIVVTGAFAFTGVVPVKQLGVGIALAIFIDATIIRMILVPSLMKLFGDWNWWLFGLKQKQTSLH